VSVTHAKYDTVELMTQYKHIDISSVVQIEEWDDLEDVLAGSRVKTTVSNPKKAAPENNNLYIFRHPKPQREAQIWSELIASYIAGDLLGWPVQHAQIAMRGAQVGNLLEYVYTDQSEFIPGELLCKHVDVDFDPKEGTRHTWNLIKRIPDEFFIKNKEGPELAKLNPNYSDFWARTVAFDTLISNTDRHAENWAVIQRPQDKLEMSPFFDNATSLGCEVDEASLQSKWFDNKGNIIESKVKSYTSNGRHHLRDGENRFKFEALAQIVLNEFPNMRHHYEAVANLDLLPVERLISSIKLMTGLPEAALMTSQRGVQIMTLLREGQARVTRCLEDSG
jgi:hypothetical protein